MACLGFTVACPKCSKIHEGKRRERGDVLLEFECKGRVRSGHPCGQRFSVKFFDEERAGERKPKMIGCEAKETNLHLLN